MLEVNGNSSAASEAIGETMIHILPQIIAALAYGIYLQNQRHSKIKFDHIINLVSNPKVH